MIRRLLSLFFASRESERGWIPFRVSRRDFEWRVAASSDTADFAVVDEVLRIRSRDAAFDIAVGIKHHESFSVLGPLVVLGREFPLVPHARAGHRIAFPGSGFVRYGIIHTALVQSIVQRCFTSRRRVKEVDTFGIPVGLADHVVDLCRHPVRELEEQPAPRKENL